MTRIYYEPDAYHLTMEGHANFDIAGDDVVCAACSMLLWTLVNAADEPGFRMELWTDKKAGSAEIWCDPEEESKEKCRYLFDTIFSGMEILAEMYPDHVKTGGSYGNE